MQVDTGRDGSVSAEPAPTTPAPPITLADCLALPELRGGLPELVAGASHLQRPIRWAHAGEVPHIASLLTGGELLLTTGIGIGRRPGEQRNFIAALAEHGIAALVVELGSTFPSLPPSLIESAEEHGLPLVALHREIPFVAVTEAIHTEIVNRRYTLLSRSDEIAHQLSQILLDGGGVPDILDALAHILGNPVYLEDAAGQLLYHAYDKLGATIGVGTKAASLPSALDAWDAIQAKRGGDPLRGGVSRAIPFGSRPGATGRLLVLPVRSPLDELAEAAAARAADIIALALMRSRQEEEMAARQRGGLLADLAAGRVTGDEAARQARLVGFAGASTLILPVAAAATGEPPAAEWNLALHDIQAELNARGLASLLGPGVGPGTLLAAIGVGDRSDRSPTAEVVAGTIRASLTGRYGHIDVTIVVGRAVPWAGAGQAIALARESAASATSLAAAPWHDMDSLELQRLLWHWRDDAALREFIQRTLGPMLEHDGRRRHPLLPTLQTLCDHGWRKAETARALSLNRQALYRRLERIERLLEVDLGDPETMLRLHLALRARSCAG